MQQTKVLETWVGLFVALGLVALFFLAMKVSNLADLQIKDDSYRLIARFQNAGSLREKAPVSMGGVRIGRVSAIRFDKETYEAVVEMHIDPEYDTIPTDTTANILTAGLLGEQYIGLSAGGAPEFLKEGDTIELSQSAMVLEEVISRFLFNKAEGGSDKKDSPSAKASGSDVEADNSIAEAAAAKPKSVEKGGGEGEIAATHKAKAKQQKGEVEIESESVHKPKVTRAKSPEQARNAQKPKLSQKGGEDVDAVRKTKPVVK